MQLPPDSFALQISRRDFLLIDYLQTLIDDVELNHSDNSYTHVVVGNYYRNQGKFDEAIESYNKLESFQEQGIANLYSANHYRALSNTFKGEFDLAESFFRKNIELGNVSGAYTYLPEMFLHKGDYDAAISVIEIDDVLDARIVSGLHIWSSSEKISVFSERISGTASTTKSTSAQTSLDVEVVILALAALASP